jgi:glycosyltransferase involved in cell wall biosynthesis
MEWRQCAVESVEKLSVVKDKMRKQRGGETIMKNRSKISVIMLTYNREKLVGRMIECIRSQTLTDFEFIIVDNGSTDSSGKIADSYLSKDCRIRVMHLTKGNIGSGRNAGLDVAVGEYIAFVDDDDYCENDYLQFLYGLAAEHNADVSICGATWANIDETRIMTPEEALIVLLQRKNYNVAFPTKLFKREMFDKNRFLETGKYDDIYLMPKMLASANKVAYHGLSKYHFTRHEGNNSAWTQNHKLLDAGTLQEYLDVYKERTAWLSERFPNSADKWRYFNWSFMLSMVEKVSGFDITECFPVKELMRNELINNLDEFSHSELILDFEKKWLEMFIL